MPTKAELAALIARVEVATGPDQELDADICLACGAKKTPEEGFRGWFPIWWTMPGQPNTGRQYVWSHRMSPWRITEQIDTALALVELMLPGWTFILDTIHTGYCDATLYPANWPHAKSFDAAVCPSLPLAICLALLRALHAQALP